MKGHRPSAASNLLWVYEVSEDGGKSWHPEIAGDAARPEILRRGAWISPTSN